jgi:hypothetical protein
MCGRSTCGRESRPVVGVKRYLGYLSFDIIEKQERLVAKLVVSLITTTALWVGIQTFLKNMYIMGDISKEVANTL